MTEPEPIEVSPDGLTAINLYVATQLALHNWPHDDTWAGDEVLLALLDTYEAVALLRSWDRVLGPWEE